MKVLIFLLVLILGADVAPTIAQSARAELTLAEAIDTAIATDPWLTGSRHSQAALTDEGTAAATLPDPKISLMAGNFPLDTFDINQEAMTQLSVGISQMFPRGDTLALAQRQKLALALQHPLLREDRRAKVTATVSQLWLSGYEAQESIRLIEQDRSLFEHLVDAARASYATAIGKARQQDVIRAQLELTQLEDRLTTLKQHQDIAQMQLSEWIGARAENRLTLGIMTASPSSPAWTPGARQASYERVSHHPLLLALDKRIEATDTDVDLARQKYKPEWGLNAQYGYRDRDMLGRDRSDLFSIGITVDLPLFTANRQDKAVSAAIGHAEAIRTEKQLLLRRLMAELETASAYLARLDERHALYTDRLLPQMAEQSQASLAAYNNNDGDFAEAVRARIAELNAKIEALMITVDRHKTIAQINYLLIQSSSEPTGPVTAILGVNQ